MKTTALVYSIVICLIFSFGGRALAVEKITIPNDNVKVYSNPSVTSPVLTILKKGRVVTAGVNPGGGFKKVLVTDVSGKKVIGYVTLMDLKAPIFAVTPDPKDQKIKKGKLRPNGLGLRGHYALGVEIGLNYQRQSTSQVSDSAGDSASVSGLSATDFIIGINFSIPVKPTFSLETDLLYKPIGLTGNGTAANSTSLSNISDRQNFAGLSETAKFYSAPNSDWWYGPGVEIDYGISGSLQVGTANVYQFNSSDLKTLYGIYFSTGYDFMSKNNFYITPAFRLGAYLNGSPLIVEANVTISGAYRF
jgi:hypothetical protein